MLLTTFLWPNVPRGQYESNRDGDVENKYDSRDTLKSFRWFITVKNVTKPGMGV